jgi:DnaD/phage-associated family protein
LKEYKFCGIVELIKFTRGEKMAFVEFSSEVVAKSVTTIDNLFITEFMPNANENCVKVYLYGLYKCASGKDNSLEDFEKKLNISKEDIVSIFYYWQEIGLVQVIDVEPLQVKYLPVKNALSKIKKYNVDKYTGFNISAQELYGSKMLTPRELEEFYYLIENLKMEKEAVLKIIQYCAKQKGENVAINYITTVAKNWAYDGVKTSEDVDNKLADQERITGDITLVLKAMGLKRSATIEEYEMYLNWTKNLDVKLDMITHLIKLTKCKNFKKLDGVVNKCYSLRLESFKEVDDYFQTQENMMALAKDMVKKLGLWYDDLTVVVDTYVSSWLQLGFDENALIKLADYAFRSSVRTLDGLNKNINNMFKLGLLSVEAIDNHISGLVKNDDIIKNILEKLGIDREVNSTDRTLYKTWLYSWELNDELINFACEESVGKYLPLQYLNKVLANYHNNGVKTIEEAKKCKLSSDNIPQSKSTQSSKEAIKREYSKKELDSLFANIEEVEI